MVGAAITSGGFNLMFKRLYGDAGVPEISVVKFGAGTTTPAIGDTAMESSVQSNSIQSVAYDTTDNKVTVRSLLTLSQGNGYTISECGEFNASSVMVSHDVFTGISKTSSEEIVLVVVHQLTA